MPDKSVCFGAFHRLCSNLDPALLHDTLPGFHITPSYLHRYHQVAAQTANKDDYCADFIGRFEAIADSLELAKKQGRLPLRVIHGDPKLNNFLFAKQNRRIISLIDLDTVKPGLVHYDIGDCLRSCCHNEETDIFDLTICAAFLKTYLAEAGCFFSADDYRYLYDAIRLIPFELGLRFTPIIWKGTAILKSPIRYRTCTGPADNSACARTSWRKNRQ